MKNLVKKFIPLFALDWYHFSLPLLGVFLYRFPSRKIKVIGVTGTNGKTTAVHLISKILEGAGYRVASISSIRFKIGDREYKNTLKMTMPGRLKLQKFLRQAVDNKCDYMILEVTSEGIKQHRHRFIDFNTAVFTNLTEEHIESHGSFEKYKQAKGIGAKNSISIVNLDDANADYFLGFDAGEKIGYAIQGSRSGVETIIAKDCELSASGIKFSVDDIEFNLSLLGKFNVYNALAAICTCTAQEIDLQICAKALEKFEYNALAAICTCTAQEIDLQICAKALEKFEGMPGRMEIVARDGFSVIVDYAHTPDALEKVFQTIKLISSNSRIIGIIGAAGGGRDKWKRPKMGKIADKYCDEIIITNEDPYDENPEQILSEIEKGISNHKALKIIDRKQAIAKSLSLASNGDIVIITGKGSEPWMCVANGKKIPWDDCEIALAVIARSEPAGEATKQSHSTKGMRLPRSPSSAPSQ
jgi:UDP-N-acetylmuramoyl-L-alanyl-D-glutamate--2,6-diaminopimelate ligase